MSESNQNNEAPKGLEPQPNPTYEEVRKEYIDTEFNKLSLSDMYQSKLQVHGGAGGATNWLNITNEQVKAIHAILAGDRVLGHDPSDSIASVWCVDDVLSENPRLTKEQAMYVLHKVQENHDATIGINWDAINYWADELYPEDINQ